MGPIRAFLRPSHGAAPGEFAASTASPFGPTQNFSDRRRPCCAHATPYPPNPHPHLYGQACRASDPLRVGLATSSAATQLYHHHFRKLLPPGATALGPDSGLAASRQAERGAGHDAEERGKSSDERGGQSDWKDGDYEDAWRKDRDECAWKKGCGGGKWKKSGRDIKWRRFSEEYKWKRERYDDGDRWKRDEYKWRKERDEYKWQKNKDSKWKRDKKEFHWKKDSDVLKCGKEEDEEEDHKWKKDKDDYRWKKDKVTPPPCLSPLAKAEEPSSSRMALVFPFSDEEDDEEDECRDADECKHQTWPISDIVETEDEDGEAQTEGSPRDSPGRKEEDDGVPGTVEASGAKERASGDGSTSGGPPIAQEPLLAGAPGTGPQDSVAADASEADPLVHPEDNSQDDGPPPPEEDEQEEPECGGKQEEKEPEDERKGEEVDSPRDGIRATQRLRPRSYRQFLLTRERRSRVFLKARSYHLGRWFVSHFTHPYPSKDQKDQLAARTNMTRNQVSEWFGNMRRRIREATRGMGVCWEERVRLYNSVITGKSEPLPIQPGDAINTWVPPIAQESPASESHEEVSVSPKFKTTLLQRYLNNSLDAPTRPAEPARPSTSASPPDGDPQELCGSSTSSEPSAAFSRSLPLCTSSPKESFQALWNASFEHVKDDQAPCAANRVLSRPEHKGKSQNAREQGEEEGRVIKKYDRQRSQNYSSVSFKRQRTMEPREDWRPQASTSGVSSAAFLLGRSIQAADGEGSRRQDSPTSYLHLSSWSTHTTPADGRSSDEEGVPDQCMRQPEELAAAYTLMQLQHM